MSSSAIATVAISDVLKLWLQIPTKALLKRYMKVAGVSDKQKAATILQAYKTLLALKVLSSDYEDESLAAPPAVHVMWKEHILDTAAYADHCRTLCGRVINHAPYEPADDRERHNKRCQRALAAYKKHLGEAAPSEVCGLRKPSQAPFTPPSPLFTPLLSGVGLWRASRAQPRGGDQAS